MRQEELIALISKWCLPDNCEAERYFHIRSLTNFLEGTLYCNYEPTQVGTHGPFGARLARWIGNADAEWQKKSLFLILGHLIFLSREEMRAGYLTAFSKNVLHWLLEVEELPYFGAETEGKLRSALSRTAFTEITDSFRLGNFFRWNNLDGQSPRYTWEQHLANWDMDRFLGQVMGFDAKKNITSKNNLVLLEDFVGSGSQMAAAVRNACEIPQVGNVLLCPIVICPAGARLARNLVRKYKHLTFSPVIELPESSFLLPDPHDHDHPEFFQIRKALLSLHCKVKGTEKPGHQSISAFGFGDTGALFCKYDNCPDNTLSAIHHKSDSGWEPLFPRISREAV